MIIGRISDNKYTRGTQETQHLAMPSSLVKAADADEQRWSHQADLLQPRLADGTVNPEFVEVYYEESREYGFIPKERDY